MLYINKEVKDMANRFMAIETGTYTVVAADDTAGTVDIDLEDSLQGTDITGILVQILRAGVDVKEDAVVTYTDDTITVADGAATYALTANDVIHYCAFTE